MNPIEEFKERAFYNRAAHSDMRAGFDIGWDAAIEVTAPIIEVAIATWRALEHGTGYVSVEGLGGAGKNALAAAIQWQAVREEQAKR